jgi:Winged helix DNA-binding domain
VTTPTLTTRARNRALLSRQLLLDRSALAIPAALEQMGGLQNQYAPNAYIGLWSRLVDLRRDSVTDALVDRAAVQGTLMRATIHLVSRDDYWPMCDAIRESRRTWWLRVNRPLGRHEAPYERIADIIASELANGPRTRAELVAAMAASGFDKGLFEGVPMWIDLVRVPPSGTWERRRADRFELARSWIPRVAPPQQEDDAVRHLIRRYLGAFGPASLGDVVSWSGLPRPIIERCIAQLELLTVLDERGEQLLDLHDASRPDPDVAAPVRLLPTWDACLLVHARRSGVLPEALRPMVFRTSNPQSVGIVLVDGVVAGTWSWRTDHVEVTDLVALGQRARRAVRDEAARLTDFFR